MKAILSIAFVLLYLNVSANNCKGTTKAGQPCKSTFVAKTGYCRMHNPNAKHCPHVKDGKQCGMVTDGSRCRFHK